MSSRLTLACNERRRDWLEPSGSRLGRLLLRGKLLSEAIGLAAITTRQYTPPLHDTPPL